MLKKYSVYRLRGKRNRSYKIQWIRYSILRRLFKKQKRK